jgi:hypothetical protein
MYFSLKIVLTKAGYFLVSKDFIFLVSNQIEILTKSLEIYYTIDATECADLKINFSNTVIEWMDYRSNMHFFNLEKKVRHIIPDIFTWNFAPSIFNDRLPVSFINTEIPRIGLLDVCLNKYVWTLDGITVKQSLITSNRVHIIDSINTYYQLNFDTGKPLKYIDLAKVLPLYVDELQEEIIYNSKKILGVFEKSLILSLEKNRLVTINIESEVVDWFPSEALRYESLSKLSEDSSRYFSLSNHHYVVVNVKEKEVKIKDIESICKLSTGVSFTINASNLSNNHIYFIGTIVGFPFSSGVVGAFNFESEQFDWVQELSLEKGHFLVDPPQLDEERLYVMDTEGCLFVFAPQ